MSFLLRYSESELEGEQHACTWNILWSCRIFGEVGCQMHGMDDRIGVAGTTAVLHRENKTARKDQTVADHSWSFAHKSNYFGEPRFWMFWAVFDMKISCQLQSQVPLHFLNLSPPSVATSVGSRSKNLNENNTMWTNCIFRGHAHAMQAACDMTQGRILAFFPYILQESAL